MKSSWISRFTWNPVICNLDSSRNQDLGTPQWTGVLVPIRWWLKIHVETRVRIWSWTPSSDRVWGKGACVENKSKTKSSPKEVDKTSHSYVGFTFFYVSLLSNSKSVKTNILLNGPSKFYQILRVSNIKSPKPYPRTSDLQIIRGSLKPTFTSLYNRNLFVSIIVSCIPKRFEVIFDLYTLVR